MKWINKVPLLVLTLQMLFALPASAQNGTWTTKASMPTARYSLGVGVINGKIYAIGGTTSVTSSGSDFSVVEVYDPANNTWSTVAPMPTPRHGFGVGVVSGVLYTIGGYSFNTCNCLVGTVEAYDPISNTWSTKASMPTVRQDLVVAAINDGLYAVGGGNGGYLSTVEAYDPASDSWSTKSSMPTPRLGPAAGVVDGILYVVGGGTPSGSITTNEAYNPVSDTWSTKASMPTARYFTGAMGGGTVTVNEILYVIGGITSGHNTTSASEAYDATSDSWTQIAPMPTSRAPGIGIVNGVLYAVGGYDYVAGTALATNEAFTPMPSGVAVLNGGNAFTGNQTVSGSVSATSFVGSGASLTGVDAATLGGVAPSHYARVDIGNSFSGDQNVNGSVVIGGGTAITKHLSALFNPALAALKPATCSTASFTLTGAADGDTLALGVPNARTIGGTGVILNYFAWVSATNTVTIQACNLGSSPQKTVGSGAFRVDLWKH